MGKKFVWWFAIIIKWNIMDWEVIISTDKDQLAYYASQFDDPDNFDKPKPFNQKSIKIHKMQGGPKRGPLKSTIIKCFQIPPQNQSHLIITNLNHLKEEANQLRLRLA